MLPGRLADELLLVWTMKTDWNTKLSYTYLPTFGEMETTAAGLFLSMDAVAMYHASSSMAVLWRK